MLKQVQHDVILGKTEDLEFDGVGHTTHAVCSETTSPPDVARRAWCPARLFTRRRLFYG
jgi:hypothetical protein